MANVSIIEKKEGLPILQVTPALIGLICQAVGRGMKFEEACALVGLSSTKTTKLKKDAIALNEGSPKSLEFEPAYKALLYELINRLPQAQAGFIDSHLRNIEKHSEKDWKASQYLLVVTNPERFKPESILKVQHSDVLAPASTRDVKFEELPDSELLKIIEGDIILEEDINSPSAGPAITITEYEQTDSDS